MAARPTPSSSSPSQREAEAEAPSSPPTTSAQPLAPQSPYVVISSSSSRDRPSRRLRIPSDYSADGSTAEAVIAATGEGSPLLASRRDLANREGDGGGGGVRGSIYALTADVDGDGTDAQQPLPGTGIVRRPRPRFWYLLPLVSLLDVLLESAVSFPLLFPSSTTASKPNPDNPSGSIDPSRVRTLTATLLSACLLRCATLSIISIGNRTDQLGLIVAGVCAASALVGVSVFNLLFQVGALSPSRTSTFTPSSSWRTNLPTPTLTLLTSLGLSFTVLEYILYVIVVGIRVPPSQGQAGGVRRMGDVRRWKRGVRAAAAGQHGQGGGSDWSVYMDEEDDDDAEEGGAGEDVEPTRKRRRGSYVDPAATLTPGNSGNLEVAGSSGSKSSSLLLLPEAALTPPPTSTSYGALEASRPLSSLLPQSAFSAASTAAEGSVRGGNGGVGDRRRTTSTTSTRSRSRGLDTALPTSSSTSPTGSTGRARLSASPSRSPSRTNPPPPVDLEAGAAPHTLAGDEEEEDEDEDGEDADPNEILDIPSFPSSTSRDASRMRLAMANEPASSRGRRLSAIRGGDESREESREGEVEEQVEEVVEVAVPQRRRGWRTGGGGVGAGATSLLPFKRKKPQRGDSGAPAAGTDDTSTQSSSGGGGGGWRAGGRRLLRSALPGGGGGGGGTSSGAGSRS